MKKGFTLTEVVVVIGIILVLSAIGFSLAAPIRVKALEQQSVGNLSSIYKAMLLYSADTDSFDEVEGLGSVPLGSGFLWGSLGQYGAPREIFFSPIAPESRNLAPTYRFPIALLMRENLFGNSASNTVGPATAKLKEEREQFALVIDPCFEALHYWPREREADPYMLRKHSIELKVSGEVKLIRRQGLRSTEY